MARARETADIIHDHLPEIQMTESELLREGAPYPPEPPLRHWRPDYKVSCLHAPLYVLAVLMCDTDASPKSTPFLTPNQPPQHPHSQPTCPAENHRFIRPCCSLTAPTSPYNDPILDPHPVVPFIILSFGRFLPESD